MITAFWVGVAIIMAAAFAVLIGVEEVGNFGTKTDEVAKSCTFCRLLSTDIRWAVQAQMTLQTGMMQLTRSIAQPTTF